MNCREVFSMTYKEIYDTDPDYWKSPANVRKITLRALRKLRERDGAKQLRDLVEMKRDARMGL
jgi:hypothetical protein